jgi:hypothetical protein
MAPEYTTENYGWILNLIEKPILQRASRVNRDQHMKAYWIFHILSRNIIADKK